MKPLPHTYDVKLAGSPGGYASLAVDGLPDVRSAPPPAFDGPGDAWSPEHLLLAAVESCVFFTLHAVARASRVEFAKVDVSATGTVDQKEGRVRFTDIVLRLRLTAGPGADRARIMRVVEKSERACLVSASLSTPIRLEPEIVAA